MIMEKLGIALTDWESYSEDNFDTIIWKNGAKCTKEEWDKAKAELQAEYDANQYQRDREYPAIGEQLDMLFHDMTAGKGSKDGEWYKAVAKVKADNPKPE